MECDTYHTVLLALYSSILRREGTPGKYCLSKNEISIES